MEPVFRLGIVWDECLIDICLDLVNAVYILNEKLTKGYPETGQGLNLNAFELHLFKKVFQAVF